MKKAQALWVTLGFTALLLAAAHAQTDYSTATLKGRVLDPQGAVVVKAVVTATNTGTGIAKTTQSGPDGSYQVPALPPGVYTVIVEAPGFGKVVVKKLELSVGQILVFDASLKVGGVNDSVEVGPDSTVLIAVEQSQQADTINTIGIENLPNLGRAFTYNVYTLPGVSNSDAQHQSGQTPGFTGYLTSGYSVGGSNGRNNLSTLDGGENDYGTGAYRVTNLPVDAIQEFQVNRNGFAAEFGFTSGSAINVVTKSGTNQWHGSGFGYFRDQSTSATNFFNGLAGSGAAGHKAFSQNVYLGDTLGGAIVPNKLFFFTAYEYGRVDTPFFNFPLSDPRVQGPSTPQTSYVNALKASGDPFLVGFANGITPGLSPLNNPSLNRILTRDNGIFNEPDRLHNSIVRFDYAASQRDSINLRGIYAHNDFKSPLGFINNGTSDGYGLFARDFSVLTTWTRTISSNVVNQALFQFARNRNDALPNPFVGVNFSLGSDTGICAAGPAGTPSCGSPSLVPYIGHQWRFQFEDNITVSRGAHTFKFGASYRPANYHVENDLWFNPQFDFADGAVPLISLAPAAVQAHLVGFNLTNGFPATGPVNTNLSGPQSFAFGVPVDVLAGFNNPVWKGWGHYFGSYAQDSWKISQRLTLNAGVRLDYDGEPAPIGGSFYASPRLGIAWDPFGDHKTVVRASGGTFVAPVTVLIPSYGSLLDGSGRYINEVLSVLSPTDPTVAKLWGLGVAKGELPFGHLTPADFAAVGINTTTPGASVGYSVAPNYKNPYTIQAALSVDRELAKNLSLELGYNMYHGVHLTLPLETAYSAIAPGNSLCPTPACTDPTGGPLYAPTTGQVQHTAYTSIGSSIYHGFTSSLTKRFTSGLQFQVNYTWSKSIDDVIDFSSFQNWFRPSRLDLYRATSVFDVPHILVANAVYQTQFKPGTGNALSSILSDISIAPFVTVRSGLPYTVLTPALNNKLNGQMLDNNFATPFGAPRDANRGPFFTTTDLRLSKAFFINRERGVKVDLIAEGTNVFNRVNFDKVNDVFPITYNGPFTGLQGVKPQSTADLGTPLVFSHADKPRQVQFGLKMAF
ncbi:MAG TPA: carboxypeptidase regulatory-like domain-containing protein [Candidatus Angelobacter sp.]|nr:carboxypeptidase regulatory-like domain-containing protein [Candidatus Angelobacter sp.]